MKSKKSQAHAVATNKSRRPLSVGGKRRATDRTLWIWMTLACVLLGASGELRRWQGWRAVELVQSDEGLPRPLKDLPKTLGNWRYLEGSEASLDPEIAQVTGCADHVIRTYVDELTGVGVTACVLYGRAESVSPHTPEVCYPSAGYVPYGEPALVQVEGSRGPAVFRTLAFVRGEGTAEERNEVLYSFLHDGRWSPITEGRWKEFRQRPRMIKVQIQRRVAEGERRDPVNPGAEFLQGLVLEVERVVGHATERRTR
jgi:hypothetical protein